KTLLQRVTGYSLVPGGGVEPPRPCDRRILSPLRLPVPPSRLLGCGTSLTRTVDNRGTLRIPLQILACERPPFQALAFVHPTSAALLQRLLFCEVLPHSADGCADLSDGF